MVLVAPTADADDLDKPPISEEAAARHKIDHEELLAAIRPDGEILTRQAPAPKVETPHGPGKEAGQ